MGEVTNWDVIRFYQRKAKHYGLSDDFIRKYRQERGGYIQVAKAHGICTDQPAAEPDQKWHLLKSYLGLKIETGKIKRDDAANFWGRLRCPELLLWMAEAAGCDIEEAKKAAEEKCETNERYRRAAASKKIREVIPWSDIEVRIEDELRD